MARKEIGIGIAGIGTVGAAVARLLMSNRERLAESAGASLAVRAVSGRDQSLPRSFDTSLVRWFDDPVALANAPGVDMVVELIGGAEGVAHDTVRAALNAKKPVVTANKALIAAHGLELAALAEQSNVSLAFEAAVAGGVPIIKTLREGLVGNHPRRVVGILNGTCNYILTRMESDGLSFGECLAAAQALGYAEADPGFDIDGHDSAHKLAILASLAFGTRIAPEAVYVEGIRSITSADIKAAADLGYRIKLLGVARRTDSGIEQRVHPTMVPAKAAIAQVDGVLNAVSIDGDLVRTLLLVGPGAGGEATASAVLADIVDVARGIITPPFGRPAKLMRPYEQAEMRAHEGGYYVRLAVNDRPGAFAAIATRMAEARISLESIVQRGRAGREGAPIDEPQPVILITYETTEAAIRQALDAIERDGHIVGPPQMIRIEKL